LIKIERRSDTLRQDWENFLLPENGGGASKRLERGSLATDVNYEDLDSSSILRSTWMAPSETARSKISILKERGKAVGEV